MTINLGVVGCGFWGPNLARNFSQLPEVRISMVCDLDTARARAMADQFARDAEVTADFSKVIGHPGIDAIVIATPTPSHYTLTLAALQAGKHVFVEKPLATSVPECEELIEAAERRRLTLMVGHVFLYNPAVTKIKEYLDAGELGQMLYIYSRRVNLGRIQGDLNALWSFAPHDLSILDYWLGEEPVTVRATGFRLLSRDVEDVVFVFLEYPGGVGVHLHLSWLDPKKVREMILVGAQKMVVYDDVSVDAKIQVYDKGVREAVDRSTLPSRDFGEFQFLVRSGDLVVPHITFVEPLWNECRHFVDCVTHGHRPRSDGRNGRRIVKILNAAEQSLKTGGFPVTFV